MISMSQLQPHMPSSAWWGLLKEVDRLSMGYSSQSRIDDKHTIMCQLLSIYYRGHRYVTFAALSESATYILLLCTTRFQLQSL